MDNVIDDSGATTTRTEEKTALTTLLPLLAVTATSVVLWTATRATSESTLTQVLLACLAAPLGAGTSLALAPTMRRLCSEVAIPTGPTTLRAVPALITAAVWPAALLHADGAAILPAWLVLTTLCVWAAWIDQHTLRFPLTLIRAITTAALVLGLGAAAIDHDWTTAARAFAAGTGVFAFHLILAITTRGYPGLADVRLSFTLGATLGWISWPTVVAGILYANVLALVVEIAKRLLHKHSKEQKEFGFAPFLVLGTILAIATRWPTI